MTTRGSPRSAASRGDPAKQGRVAAAALVGASDARQEDVEVVPVHGARCDGDRRAGLVHGDDEVGGAQAGALGPLAVAGKGQVCGKQRVGRVWLG